MCGSDDGRVAIFAAPSTRLWGRTILSFCAFFAERLFRWRERNPRYATVEFIAALCAVPDRAPSRLDRRDCRCQSAGGRRIGAPSSEASDSPHKAAAFGLLGLIFVFNGTLWCLGVAAFAASAAGGIRQSGQVLRWINRALGGLFVYLGVRVAMLEAR